MNTKRVIHRFFASILILAFMVSDVRVYAQGVIDLPVPGTRLALSPTFVPPLLKGIKVYRNDPFRFDFILDKGDAEATDEQVKTDSTRLIKYFLASLAVPEKDLWVNLSPYEKDRIVPEAFGQTEMGRDLLAQDYILKQITASVIYPDEKVGKEFWDKVYAAALSRYGTTDVPVDTFNKVWIIPEKATVYENKDAAFVVESKLKVMLETDYLAMENNSVGEVGTTVPEQTDNRTSEMTKSIIREVVIPILEKEVNEGKSFAPLRQVYNSLILATWYKRKVKASIMGEAYVDQKKTGGIDIADKNENEKIWSRYVEAFKKGAFNLIKEEQDATTQEVVPRKYFSGGVLLDFSVKTEPKDQLMLTISDLPADYKFPVDVAGFDVIAMNLQVLQDPHIPKVTAPPADFVQEIGDLKLTYNNARRYEEVEFVSDLIQNSRNFINYATGNQLGLATDFYIIFVDNIPKHHAAGNWLVLSRPEISSAMNSANPRAKHAEQFIMSHELLHYIFSSEDFPMLMEMIHALERKEGWYVEAIKNSYFKEPQYLMGMSNIAAWLGLADMDKVFDNLYTTEVGVLKDIFNRKATEFLRNKVSDAVSHKSGSFEFIEHVTQADVLDDKDDSQKVAVIVKQLDVFSPGLGVLYQEIIANDNSVVPYSSLVKIVNWSVKHGLNEKELVVKLLALEVIDQETASDLFVYFELERIAGSGAIFGLARGSLALEKTGMFDYFYDLFKLENEKDRKKLANSWARLPEGYLLTLKVLGVLTQDEVTALSANDPRLMKEIGNFEKKILAMIKEYGVLPPAARYSVFSRLVPIDWLKKFSRFFDLPLVQTLFIVRAQANYWEWLRLARSKVDKYSATINKKFVWQILVAQGLEQVDDWIAAASLKVDGIKQYIGESRAWIVVINQGLDKVDAWMIAARKKVEEIRDEVGGDDNAWVFVISHGLKKIESWLAQAKVKEKKVIDIVGGRSNAWAIIRKQRLEDVDEWVRQAEKKVLAIQDIVHGKANAWQLVIWYGYKDIEIVAGSLKEKAEKMIADGVAPSMAWEKAINGGVGVVNNAMAVEDLKGGVDLNPSKIDMTTKNSGEEIKFSMDPAMLARLQNASGVTPVIVGISSLGSLQQFMGVPDPAIRSGTHT